MRHAPSQAADGLHLLRLKQLLFEFRFFFLGLPLLGNVPAGADGSNWPPHRALPVEERLRPDTGPADRSIRQYNPMLHVEKAVPCRIMGALDRRGGSIPVAWVDAFQIRFQCYRCLGAPAMDRPLLRRPVDGAGDMVVIENADMGNADRLPQPFLALA